jgi:hypothetical protein
MIRFEVIKDIDSIKDQIQILIKRHYAELTLDKDVMKLAPDWDRYNQLNNDGKLSIVAAYDNEKIVGYSVFFLNEHIHYKNNIIANNDVLFLAPEYRLGMTGIKLIKYSEMILQQLGVSKVIWHVKMAKDFRKLLHRMGYQDEDIIVGRALKEI